jgi:hypothetical protein
MAAIPFPTPVAPNPTPNPALTPVQEQVIAFLAAGSSIRKITRTAQIHRNTIGNWRRSNPAFARALANAQYERILAWRDEAEEHAELAIQTIGEMLQDRKTPPSIRLRAALAMLKHATTLPPAPPEPPTPVVQSEESPEVHNSAQSTDCPQPEKAQTAAHTTGRNATCPCGSGRKHKQCCLNRRHAATVS